MLATVTICAWNRATLLDRTIVAMHQLCIPMGIDRELLVLNNTCMERTDEVALCHMGSIAIRLLSIDLDAK